MRKIKIVTVLFLFLILSINMVSQSDKYILQGKEYQFIEGKWYSFLNGKQSDEIIPNRIVVRLKNKGYIESFNFQNLNLNGISLGSSRFLDGFYVLNVAKEQDAFFTASVLDSTGLFDVLEFDGFGKRSGVPYDPRFTQQWNLSQTKLKMVNAWDITTGNSSVILGVIDSGIKYGHEDLDGNIWVNPAEDRNGNGKPDFYWYTQGGDLDGIDQDNNDKVDDLIGWDFAGGENNPTWPYEPDNNPDDTDGHGTNVAGVSSAQTNNYEGSAYKGISGIAGGWGTKKGVSLMVIRDGGVYPISSLTALAIDYAVSKGVNVINISSEFGQDYPHVRQAVDTAVSNGVVIVAGTGNNGATVDPSIRYPAKYSNTIAVGASDQNDNRISYSAYGPEIDVVAPSEVPSTDRLGGYTTNFPGTSASTPHVSAVVSLIRSVNPSLTWDVVRDIVRNTADKVPAMGQNTFTNEYGYGRINALKAVWSAAPNKITVSSPMNSLWNMASVPVIIGDYKKTIVWQNANHDAFAWEGGPQYIAKDLLENRIGYWIRFPQSQTINYLGVPKDSFNIGVKTGWNMIGSIYQDVPTSKVYSDPLGIVETKFFGYEGGYKTSDVIKTGKGYWVKVSANGKIILDKNSTFSGTQPQCSDEQPANPTGAPAIPELVKPDSGATGISISPIFRWKKSSDALSYRLQISTNNCFTNLIFDDPTITDTLKQVSLSYSTTYYWRVNAYNGVAHSSWSNMWVFTTQSAPQPDPCDPVASLSALDNFIITDANGNSQAMYIRNAGRAVNLGISDFDMPPVSPKGLFNVRFQSNKFIETVLPNQKIKRMPIVIKDAQYPINISWDIKWQNNTKYWLTRPGGEDKILLSGNGNLFIGSSQNDVLFVEAQSAIPIPCEFYKQGEGEMENNYTNIPTEYVLEQNQPNPFNPVTQIKFSIPEAGYVTLKIYDVLGREVSELVNGWKEAGTYDVVWDASRFSSGVYFYKLQAGNFISVKKMLLAK